MSLCSQQGPVCLQPECAMRYSQQLAPPPKQKQRIPLLTRLFIHTSCSPRHSQQKGINKKKQTSTYQRPGPRTSTLTDQQTKPPPPGETNQRFVWTQDTGTDSLGKRVQYPLGSLHCRDTLFYCWPLEDNYPG